MAKILKSARMSHADVQAWMKAHDITLRGLARGLHREPSLISRVIRGRVQSEPIWVEIRAYMRSPKDYPRRVAAQVARARAVLRRRGLLA